MVVLSSAMGAGRAVALMIAAGGRLRPAPYNFSSPSRGPTMPRFRPAHPDLVGIPLSLPAVQQLAAEVSAPGHFFLGPELQLEWQHLPAEDSSWEVFQG